MEPNKEMKEDLKNFEKSKVVAVTDAPLHLLGVGFFTLLEWRHERRFGAQAGGDS